MTCYHPLQGYRSKAGRNSSGRWPIVFKESEGYYDLPVLVPCGQCIGCRLERSRQCAIRCVHEASLYSDNCFITLTFDNEHVSDSLVKRDFQLFMKRLRKKYGQGIRYFHCGEYGEKCKVCGMSRYNCTLYGCKKFVPALGRPHHHAILFNFDFPDKVFLYNKLGHNLYMSPSLLELWPFGIHSIGGVTFESTAYVARYILKKITGEASEDHYGKAIPEYVTMSRRPGIAYNWFKKYYSDVYPNDYVVIRDGIKCKPPKYYDSIYDIQNSDEFANIKNNRINMLKKHAENNTLDRLEVRERLQILKADKLHRSLESGYNK